VRFRPESNIHPVKNNIVYKIFPIHDVLKNFLLQIHDIYNEFKIEEIKIIQYNNSGRNLTYRQWKAISSDSYFLFAEERGIISEH
jgi:hypothetical protein